jgi:hypothetical protein
MFHARPAAVHLPAAAGPSNFCDEHGLALCLILQLPELLQRHSHGRLGPAAASDKEQQQQQQQQMMMMMMMPSVVVACLVATLQEGQHAQSSVCRVQLCYNTRACKVEKLHG